MSPGLNSEKRANSVREIFNFCKDGENRPLFYRALRQVMADRRSDKVVDDPQRLEKYEDLFGRLNEKYVFLDPPKPTGIDERGRLVIDNSLETLSALERSDREVPQKSIDIVNSVIKAEFPDDFGSTIPELAREDIILVKPDSISSPGYRNFGIHSELFQFYKRRGHTLNESKSDVDALTIPMLPRKPIILSEVYLDRGGLPDDVKEILIARTLVHENFHRVPKPKLYTDPDEIEQRLRLLMPTFKAIHERTSPENRAQSLDDINQLISQIEKGVGGALLVDGSLVQLFAEDKDGALKVIGMSGYNFVEALVEDYANKCVPNFAPFIRMTSLGGKTGELLKSLQVGTTSATDKKYMNGVADSLEPFGLDSPQRIMQAYRNSEIPDLFLQHKKPGQYYFT